MNPKRKFIVTLSISFGAMIFLLLVAGFIFFALVRPGAQAFQELQKNLANSEELVRSADIVKNKFKSQRKDIDFIQDRFLDLEDDQQFIKFLKLLEDTIKESDLILISQNFAETSGNDSADKFLSLRLAVSGNFANLRAFLVKLENFPFLAIIDELNLSLQPRLEPAAKEALTVNLSLLFPLRLK